MLAAALSVPGSMASWDAGMLASCHLCPFILVAEPGRKVAQQALAPCVHPLGRVSEGLCQEGEWRGGRLESCQHVEAVHDLSTLPGQTGLEGSASCPAGAHVAAVCVALRHDRCSFSKYFLSTCCVVSRVQAQGTAVSRADPGVCLHRAYPLGQRWTSPRAPGNTGCICGGRGTCPCSQQPG